MTFRANSLAARDVASLVHPQTNLALHHEIGPTVIRSGRGARVYDDDGNEFIDTVGGLWCATLGHSNERLARVAYDQLNTLSYASLYRHQTNEPAVELAHRLLAIAPQAMSKVFFQQSGSEANDTAIKLVWYYHNAIGKPGKRKIIGRRNAYHGSTAVAASVGGKPGLHTDFNLPLDGFLHTDYPHYSGATRPARARKTSPPAWPKTWKS